MDSLGLKFHSKVSSLTLISIQKSDRSLQSENDFSYSGNYIIGRQICSSQLGKEKSILDDDDETQLSKIDDLETGRNVCLKWPFPLGDAEDDANTIFFRGAVAYMAPCPERENRKERLSDYIG